MVTSLCLVFTFLIEKPKQSMSAPEPTTFLFTDGSVDTKSKIGWGALLAIRSLDLPIEGLSEQIKIKQFEDTSSSKLELQTMLWALNELQASRIIAFSDSQNLIQLPTRRQRLEKQDYCSKSGRPLNQKALYEEFYQITDRIDLEVRKVKGHLPGREQDPLQKIFALVDKASRSALRAG